MSLSVAAGATTTSPPDGKLLPHPTRFPNGIRPLADYAHANGLKIGIHTCPGETDCGWDPVGGIGREALHVSQFVEWEVDYVMLDNCYMDWKIMEEKFKLWRDLFAASGRDILYKPTFPIWAPVTTTGTLLSIVETHTDEFKTGFAVMAAP